MKETSPETNEKNSNITIKTESIIKKKRVKPEIEGITVPFGSKDEGSGKPALTPAEKKLIEESDPVKFIKPAEPKITLPERKSRSGKGAVIVILLVAVLAAAGYGVYTWYYAKPGQPEAQQPNLETSFPSLSNDAQSSGEDVTGTDSGTSTPLAETASTTPSVAPSATTTPNVTASTTPAAIPAAVAKIKVNSTPTGYLNVRQSPSTSSAIVTKVYPGEAYPYTDHKYGFYQITLPNSSSGWVAEQYVVKQ